MSVQTVADTAVLHLPETGRPLGTAQDALDLIGEAWGAQAEVVTIPAARMDPAFFDLRSGLAGEFTQKLVNYHLLLVVLGDISAHIVGSDALRDYVRESNRGAHVWFLNSPDELEQRLSVAD